MKNVLWMGFVIGFWLIVSPWFLGFADISLMKWSDVLCGLLLVIGNGWQLFGERS